MILLNIFLFVFKESLKKAISYKTNGGLWLHFLCRLKAKHED